MFIPEDSTLSHSLHLLRWRIGHRKLDRLRQDIIAWCDAPERRNNPEIREVGDFLRRHPPEFIPYPFARDHAARNTPVHHDAEVGLPFVDHEGRRLYWREGRKAKRIPRDYNALLAEQDPRSPHRYLAGAFDVLPGDVIADIGAAEGIFALDVIERAGHVYLFEADTRWIKALEATFRPWQDKVTIVPKFAGAVTDNSSIRLDDYFADMPGIDFLKLDVEGAEARVLDGMRGMIEAGRVGRAAVCAYHNPDDADALDEMLRGLGFDTELSRGFMLLYREEKLAPPYLRRGMLRATWAR